MQHAGAHLGSLINTRFERNGPRDDLAVGTVHQSVPKALQAIRVSCGCTELIHVIVSASHSRAGLHPARVLHPPHVRVALFRGAPARVANAQQQGCLQLRTHQLASHEPAACA